MKTSDSSSNDLLNAVSCPACGEQVQMGLPRSVAIEAITEEVDSALDEEYLSESPRHKRRSIKCENGHQFYVYFVY
jgi:hypothetical protein